MPTHEDESDGSEAEEDAPQQKKIRVMSDDKLFETRDKMSLDARVKFERGLFVTIKKAIKKDMSLTWGVSRFIEESSNKRRRKGEKPLHHSIFLVRGTNKSNGVADWILQNAVVRIYKVDKDKVVKFKESPWIRMVQTACRFDDKQQLPEREMYPSDVVEWMFQIAVEQEMTVITFACIFPSDVINWSRDCGCYKMVKKSADSELFDSIMHMRSRKVEYIDDPRFHCKDDDVGNRVYIENNWFEMLAKLRIWKKPQTLELNLYFPMECSV